MAPDYWSLCPVDWFKCDWEDRKVGDARQINQNGFTPGWSAAMAKSSLPPFFYRRLRLRLPNYRRPRWAALEPFASRHD
jgi:hypothetical protein